MTTDVTLNGTALSSAVPEAIVTKVVRPLVGKRRHSTVEIPGRAGSWRFDEEPGDRIITLEIDLQGASFEARRAAVRALAYWADPGTTTQLVIDDEPDRYHDALLDNDPDPDEWLRAGEATLRFLVGPYSAASVLSTESASATTNPDTDSFSIPDGITAEPVVEITPAGGTLTSWTLTVNGYALTWTGTLGAGETITISSISDTVTLGANDDVNLTGTFDEEDLDMTDVSGEFPLLLEGSTDWSFEWTGTATSVSIDFTWRERFR